MKGFTSYFAVHESGIEKRPPPLSDPALDERQLHALD